MGSRVNVAVPRAVKLSQCQSQRHFPKDGALGQSTKVAGTSYVSQNGKPETTLKAPPRGIPCPPERIRNLASGVERHG
jgi:hypothetical protein